MTKKIHLLIGSNMGDRKAYLVKAAAEIDKKIGKIAKESRLYETQAWGLTNQPDFINQALEVETTLSPQETLQKLLAIETDMGRIRTEKWAERTIDIDILLFADVIVQEADLQIPHPRLPERNFALVPLMELAGETEHPILKTTIEDIYMESKDTLDVFEVE
ncbi:MAG: 2-amino-4-hydroxy-6-hydroxymethyldihydropteridine diphosphokinase [Saprospiraceae bacterium]|nr:2-amino-4-hydroxy-6-hydroxymethyldihydropteridine diphosphokinase [Saprospiraceae bacterium]